MATFGRAVTNKVLAGEGWDHCHKARLSGQPCLMFVANVVTRSVATEDERVSPGGGPAAVSSVGRQWAADIAHVEHARDCGDAGGSAKPFQPND